MDTKLDIQSAAAIMGRKGGSQTLKKYGKGYFIYIRKKSSGRKKKAVDRQPIDKRL